MCRMDLGKKAAGKFNEGPRNSLNVTMRKGAKFVATSVEKKSLIEKRLLRQME